MIRINPLKILLWVFLNPRRFSKYYKDRDFENEQAEAKHFRVVTAIESSTKLLVSYLLYVPLLMYLLSSMFKHSPSFGDITAFVLIAVAFIFSAMYGDKPLPDNRVKRAAIVVCLGTGVVTTGFYTIGVSLDLQPLLSISLLFFLAYALGILLTMSSNTRSRARYISCVLASILASGYGAFIAHKMVSQTLSPISFSVSRFSSLDYGRVVHTVVHSTTTTTTTTTSMGSTSSSTIGGSGDFIGAITHQIEAVVTLLQFVVSQLLLGIQPTVTHSFGALMHIFLLGAAGAACVLSNTYASVYDFSTATIRDSNAKKHFSRSHVIAMLSLFFCSIFRTTDNDAGFSSMLLIQLLFAVAFATAIVFAKYSISINWLQSVFVVLCFSFPTLFAYTQPIDEQQQQQLPNEGIFFGLFIVAGVLLLVRVCLSVYTANKMLFLATAASLFIGLYINHEWLSYTSVLPESSSTTFQYQHTIALIGLCLVTTLGLYSAFSQNRRGQQRIQNGFANFSVLQFKQEIENETASDEEEEDSNSDTDNNTASSSSSSTTSQIKQQQQQQQQHQQQQQYQHTTRCLLAAFLFIVLLLTAILYTERSTPQFAESCKKVLINLGTCIGGASLAALFIGFTSLLHRVLYVNVISGKPRMSAVALFVALLFVHIYWLCECLSMVLNAQPSVARQF